MLRRLTRLARLAKGGKKGKAPKKNAATSDPNAPLEMAGFQVFTADEAPTALPDEEYPDWLWGIAEPDRTITDLEQNSDNLNFKEITRLVRAKKRALLKEKNAKSLEF